LACLWDDYTKHLSQTYLFVYAGALNPFISTEKMILKRLLLLVPAVLLVILLQSVLWVPGYESQAKGNPKRLLQFVEGSIGDAKLLNPILNADSASARIVSLVFEGLLKLDENLQLSPNLAQEWSVSEQIYLTVNPNAAFPDGSTVNGAELEKRLTDFFSAAETNEGSIQTIRRIKPGQRTQTITLDTGESVSVSVELTIRIPEVIQIDLNSVDEDFSKKISSVLGDDYEENLPRAEWISIDKPGLKNKVSRRLDEFVPVIEHNPVITFQLRDDVVFHDGHTFDSSDVLFTYESIMNPRNLSPRTSDFEPIKAVEIINDHAVRVVYKRLFSPAVNAWVMGILPEHLLNAEALQAEMGSRGISGEARESFAMRNSAFNRNPIGTGQFVFRSWEGDELIHLGANENYWGRVPQYENYYYRVLPDGLAREMEFRAGALDVYRPEPHQVDRFRDKFTYQTFSSLSMGYTYIGYNNRKTLFADKRVRQALGMALNNEEIIDYVLYGEGERTTGPYPKNTLWYDHDVAPISYDPQAAIAILNSMGWEKNADGWLEKDGEIFEFNLITNNGNALRKAVLTIAQNAWQKIGVRVNTQLFEWAVFLEDFINPGKFDAVILGWQMGPDPDLYQLWHSSQSGFGQLNFVGFNNPKADALIERIRRTYDLELQKSLTHELHAMITEEQPYTFLYAPLGTRVLDKKIVMLEDDDAYAPVQSAPSGDLYYYFDRWRKLEHVPIF